MNESAPISRRRFHALAGSAVAMTVASALAQPPQGSRHTPCAAAAHGVCGLPSVEAAAKSAPPRTIKCFCADLNWVRPGPVFPAAAQDWAFIDPQEYFDYHREFGNNVAFCQAYTFGGFAFYPTKLGPLAPGPGSQLLPRLWELSRKAKMPFMSYMCVGADLVMSNHRPPWVVPTSRTEQPYGFLAPESDWTELLCRRIREFLGQFPVEWLLLDWFVYGSLKPNEFRVQPARFAKKPFQEIIGRKMPAKPSEITPEENLKYKREVLARQFHAIRAAVEETSPGTQIGFNVPYWKADEPLWRDHPMVAESDLIVTECTNTDVMEWALRVRKPTQRVMTTFFGHTDGVCDPQTWKTWYAQGCDLFAYAWGAPPNFRPLPLYDEGLKVVREAFHAIP